MSNAIPQTDTPTPPAPADRPQNWRERLAVVVEAMREMSQETDPESLVRKYSKRTRVLTPVDRLVALSRRNIDAPRYRITRATIWQDSINPWKEPHRLPVLQGGLFGELIYGDEPRIIGSIEVPGGDPAREYFDGMGSLVFIPNFDKGAALNGVVLMRRERDAFEAEQLPELVWMSNLFGRATQNLVLSAELDKAYREVDTELRYVADLQRSLLPTNFPKCETLDIAAHYATSRRAGGDYYDVFSLGDHKLGILMADVVGHGTPAAVLMAITHSLAHNHRPLATDPAAFLRAINRDLASRYTRETGAFVTAFYAVYDQRAHSLVYSNAGHPLPLVKRCSSNDAFDLDGGRSLPLGIDEEAEFEDATATLARGDQIVLYTDGITEAFSPDRQMYGVERLRRAIENCTLTASGLIATILEDVENFTRSAPPDDDRTLLVAKIR